MELGDLLRRVHADWRKYKINEFSPWVEIHSEEAKTTIIIKTTVKQLAK